MVSLDQPGEAMVKLLTILVLAYSHEPSAADAVRFKWPSMPAYAGNHQSPARARWRETQEVIAWVNDQRVYERLPEAQYWELVWYYADDLFDTTAGPDRRSEGARKLQRLIGPVCYYCGHLP